MGRTASLLGAALAGGLIAWYDIVPHIGGLSIWPELLLVCLVLMPACFGLVGLTLPFASSRLEPFAFVAVAALALVLSWAGQDISENFCKFAAATLLGWAFLRFVEELSWIVTVALIIPWVDIYSVFWGPTKTLASGKHENVFDNLSFVFLVPGHEAARLGLPDIFFFALFLAASVRFGLRPRATWVGLVVCLVVTTLGAHVLSVDGLPALPGMSLGLLVPNADVIWRRVRPGQRTDGA